MTEATTTHPRGARRDADLRRAAQCLEHRAAPVPDRLADGRRRIRQLVEHFPDRTVVTYDPRGSDRSTKPDLTSPSSAGRARRRRASDHQEVGAAGRPVRQQRWCGERAGAGREASRGRSDPGRARAAARHRAARSRERAGGRPRGPRHVSCAAASAPAWPTSSPSSAIRASSPTTIAQQPAPDPAMFGMPTEDDGNRDRSADGPDHHRHDALRARLRRPAGRADPDRHGRRRGVGGHHGEPRRLRRRRATRHASR